jgi:hypothetical protein
MNQHDTDDIQFTDERALVAQAWYRRQTAIDLGPLDRGDAVAFMRAALGHVRQLLELSSPPQPVDVNAGRGPLSKKRVRACPRSPLTRVRPGTGIVLPGAEPRRGKCRVGRCRAAGH